MKLSVGVHKLVYKTVIHTGFFVREEGGRNIVESQKQFSHMNMVKSRL